MDLIRNGWKHIFRNETSQKSLFKTFCYNKDFQKLSNKEIYFKLQSNKIKCIKSFNFIYWSNFMEGYHNLTPSTWSKIFTWGKIFKGSDGNIVSI